MKTQEKVKAELKVLVKSNKQVMLYGINEMAKDLCEEMTEDESIECIVDGCLKSTFSLLQSGKLFRTYICLTNQKLIYMKSTRMVFSIIPFFNKKVIIPKNNIKNFYLEPIKGIARAVYSKCLHIEEHRGYWEILIITSKEAELVYNNLSKITDTDEIEKEKNIMEEQKEVGAKQFCTSCGKELDEAWANCPYCGK